MHIQEDNIKSKIYNHYFDDLVKGRNFFNR